jgi:demethylsterigmatocystin 6-O-methyltransferase
LHPPSNISTPDLLLRSLASNDVITETGKNQYAASHITYTLAVSGNMAGIKHKYIASPAPIAHLTMKAKHSNVSLSALTLVMPTWLPLPAFLAANSYQNPTEPLHGAFQTAHHTPLAAFEWFPLHPSHFSAFNLWLAAQHDSQTHWFDILPFSQQLCPNLTPSRPRFVDIGGSIGRQCQA